MADDTAGPTFGCRKCQTPVALRSDLLSKSFVGKSGQAYLFSHAMNVILGRKEDKQLMTGRFTVSDVYCSNCREVLGWKYLQAYDPKQKYKEGKFIIETQKIVKEYY